MPVRGLRARSAAAFAVMALVLSATLSVATYQLARWYLLDKREALALRQASLNALTMRGQLGAGDVEPSDALEALQANTNARALLHSDDTWYTVVVQLGETAVPQSLRELVDQGGAAMQRVIVDGQPYLVYGITLPGDAGAYYEFVSAAEYERTLSVLGVILLVAASITTIGGAAAGWFISRPLLRPLTSVAESARSISQGNLSHRLDVGHDPDLRTMATAFNEMASTVEARIEREHRFTADVSHELRTPLTAMGAAVSLAKRSEMSERGEYAMRMLDEQLQQFTRLTVELLEIARIDSGVATLNVTDIDVVDLVGRVLAQAKVDPSVLSVDASMRRVWRLDGTRLERVIANLAENAERYAGGVTRFSLSEIDGVLQVEVDDDGPGVPKADRRAIFGRFNRGSMRQPADRTKGTGLGLALVDEHVRMHGGDVWVTDSPSGGARFVVRVPEQP